MGSINIEICSNCERAISRSEQAYVFEGNIVCADCDTKLRSGQQPQQTAMPEQIVIIEPVDSVESQPEATGCSNSKEVKEKGKQTSYVDRPVGFIIGGVILCFLGIALIDIGLVGLAVFFLGGFLIGILMAAGYIIFGLLILILGIASIVVAVVSKRCIPAKSSN